MDIQRHSSVLGNTVEKLLDEASYKQLFHAYRDEEALPSGEVLKEIIDLCRVILFPDYYGNARISKQTIRFHTGAKIGHHFSIDHGTGTVIGETSVIGKIRIGRGTTSVVTSGSRRMYRQEQRSLNFLPGEKER